MMTRVDVWIAQPPRVDDPQVLAAYARLLSDEEHRRQRAFVFEKNRREHLVAHALVRSVLSQYEPTLPEAWRFTRNAHGRPAIDPPSRLRFNLAHHPTLVVCAVTTGAELGVDVEPIQRGDEILSVAEGTFAEPELVELRQLPLAERADRAVSLWTLKEAYIKARGLGLSLPLAGFAFDFTRPLEPSIAFETGIDDRPERWSFRTRDVEGHRIALAVERDASELDVRFYFNVPLPSSACVPLD